jgi:hypothetical protein
VIDRNYPDTPKWLTVDQLKKVLDGMDGSLRLSVNQVGNLSTHRDGWVFVGFINFAGEGECEVYE